MTTGSSPGGLRRDLLVATLALIAVGALLVVPRPSAGTAKLLMVLAIALIVELYFHARVINRVVADVRQAIATAAIHTDQLLASAAACGLTGIYASREQAAPDVLEAMGRASSRILLLGVGFTQHVRLPEVIAIAKKRLAVHPALDLRALLADALRSPALLRMLLEVPMSAARKILSFDSDQNPDEHPIFQQRLFSDVKAAVDYLLMEDSPFVKKGVKFYAHNPGYRIIVVDDVVFVELYTLGGISLSDGTRGSAHMPVLRFERTPKNGSMFEIMLNHFNQTWETSDVDLFHMSNRLACKERLVRSVLRRRRTWLDSVLKGLIHRHSQPPRYSRAARQRCESNPASVVRLNLAEGMSAMATVVDYSRDGLGLKCRSAIATRPGARMILTCACGDQGSIARTLTRHYTHREYEVKWVDGPRLGLAIVA
jgi:hypothetical protein